MALTKVSRGLLSTSIVDNGNATAITIDSSENVGLGAGSPAAKAHIYDASTDAVLYLDSANVNGSHARFLASGSVKHFVGSGGGFGLGDVDDFAIRSFDNLIFATNNSSTERMRIDSSGNALVGRTSSLSSQLGSVSANTVVSAHGGLQSHATSAGILEHYNDETLLRSYGANAGSGKLVFKVGGGGGSADSEAMRIDSSGNVGIGISTPTLSTAWNTVLHVKSSALGAELRLADSDSGGVGDVGLSVGQYGGNSYIMNQDSGGTFFWTGGGEKMRIDSSGRVGIGTSSTDTGSMLTVAGAATFTGQNTAHGASRLKIGQDTTAISQIRFYGANTSTAGILQFIGSSSDGTVGGERMRIDASGNVLVGTTNTANLATHTPNVVTDLQYGINDGSNIASFGLDRIHFNSSNYYVLNASSTGVRLINGATSWTTQSDENSKENIVELSNALTAVNAMRCVRYNLKSQTSGDVKIGFIAQDWQSSYPEVVATDTDGILGMNYTETIPVLLKAIQEQQTLIELLTARIAALEE